MSLNNLINLINCRSGVIRLWKSISRNVPQGTILGHILFLVYINEITKSSSLCNFMFSDDTTLYLENKSTEIINYNCQTELVNSNK